MKTILRRANQNSTSPYIRMAEKPTATVKTIVNIIHTDEFKSVQYWKSTQMALISVGIESRFP